MNKFTENRDMNEVFEFEIYTIPAIKELVEDKLVTLGSKILHSYYYSHEVDGHMIERIRLTVETTLGQYLEFDEWFKSVEKKLETVFI